MTKLDRAAKRIEIGQKAKVVLVKPSGRARPAVTKGMTFRMIREPKVLPAKGRSENGA